MRNHFSSKIGPLSVGINIFLFTSCAVPLKINNQRSNPQAFPFIVFLAIPSVLRGIKYPLPNTAPSHAHRSSATLPPLSAPCPAPCTLQKSHFARGMKRCPLFPFPLLHPAPSPQTLITPTLTLGHDPSSPSLLRSANEFTLVQQFG